MANLSSLSSVMEEEELRIMEEISRLQKEHEALEGTIEQLRRSTHSFDQLRVQRLKKRKLWLKDEIVRLEAFLYPDIIA